MLNVLTPDETLELIKKEFAHIASRPERVPLCAAVGRVLYEDVAATEYVPGFDRSTVDGYAVDRFDIPLYGGDTLCGGSAVMKVEHEGKRCFGEECELFCSGTPCPLHSCRYLAIQASGVIAENDQITKEDRP